MQITIFANGKIPIHEINLPPDTMIIAADGGARHCLRLGLNPQVVIGDFDSLCDAELHQLEVLGAKLIRHPVDKDETDLELTLDYAQKTGATQVTLYGLLGGRWDMTFSNVLLLASPRYAKIDFRILDGNTEMRILRGGETLEIVGQPGDTVSVVPLNNSVVGLNYQGLKWLLEEATLSFGTPRGVSNELISTQAQLSVKEGVLLCVHIRQAAGKQINE